MKVAVVFVLLFASVLCRPARKVSESDSDSSEEVQVRRPAPQAIRRQQIVLSKSRAAPVQNVVAPAKAGSDESEDNSDEVEEAPAAEVLAEVKAAAALPAVTGSVASEDSEDSEDSDDDDQEEEESETEEEEESDSESGESSTPVPVTVTPTPGTVEPETTQDYVEPTIVTDPDAGRGDSLGAYPDDYKSIIYAEEKSYHKAPNPYKSYEIVGKKVVYDMSKGNEVEKSPKVYKAQGFQIHSDVVEEDTSTPEVETQGLDASSGTSQDQDVTARQAAVPAEEESTSSGAPTANESESSSTPEEEEEEGDASSPSESDSASAESEDEEAQSSEEAAATPGAADSDSEEDDSVEGDSDEEGPGPDATTEMPVVVTAK